MTFSHISGVVQGIVTGIRGLCNGIGPAMFGFTFYLFHVNLDELPTSTTEVPTNHTATGMEDPFNKVRTLLMVIYKIFEIFYIA